MLCSAFVAVGFNLPYYFIYTYEVDEDGEKHLVTTEFFDSE